MIRAFAASLSIAGLGALFVGSGAPSVQAAITCHDEFQRVQGQDIATPYCEDAYLAKVAREHGVKVTADRVRESASKKYELCRFLGSDPRLTSICPDDSGSGPWR